MIKSLKRINNVLPELVGIILGYGFLVELAVVWFMKDKLYFSLGLGIGIALAIGMAIHMAIVIEDSLGVRDKRDQRAIALKGILRYTVVAVVVFTTVYFDIGNILAVFIGVMGLKAAAYAQPLIHKRRVQKRNEKEVSQ